MAHSLADLMHELGPEFAARAARCDDEDLFVAENYVALKKRGVLTAGLPAELGGVGAAHRELGEMLRVLARYCGSTALALSMHTHQVATAVWRWRRDPASVEALLRSVAAKNLVLVSSGGSDWIAGSGKAERVEGGWRITARKIFASGVPVGDVLVTSAVWDDPRNGPTVLHFPLSLRASGVAVLNTWRVLGMRGTGSHDIAIDGAFVPDDAVMLRRPQGKWHLLFHVISLLAIPLIYSVYFGVAEAARDIALERARSRRNGQDVSYLVGEMENELTTARLAYQDMLDAAATVEPGEQTTNRVMTGRSILARSAIRSVEKAMEVAGGLAFYRDLGLERRFRDVQAARFHPLQEKAQLRYAGQLALGRDIDG
jgi:alkylation response protein AidB-like acyl-CoA dehydrogenase